MRTTRIGILCCALAACGPSQRNGDDMATADGNTGGGDSAGGGDGNGSVGTVYVYAHTDTELYRVDPDTLAISLVGAFQWPNGADQMTDIAIDKGGQMIGVSFTKVYRVDPTNAHATLLSASLSGTFNGLSFVPAAMLGQTGDDVLIGTRNDDGQVFRIDPMTGHAMAVGNMGAFQSSGDLVAVDGFGTVQTVLGSSSDNLARLTNGTFAANVIGPTGYGQIWGIAYWKNKVYGFTDGGDFVLIDPMTGAAQHVASTGHAWWGAAVTTLAPVIQ